MLNTCTRIQSVLGTKVDVLSYFLTTTFGSGLKFHFTLFSQHISSKIQVNSLFSRKAFWNNHIKLKKSHFTWKPTKKLFIKHRYLEEVFNQWKLGTGLENIKRMEERHCNFCLMYSGNFSFSPYLSEAKENT
jgi:hypothetical protein